MRTSYVYVAIIVTALLGVGCIAIPMGKETFTTEYLADIHPTADPPGKIYEPVPAVRSDGENKFSVLIGLEGRIVVEQPQEQNYERGSIEKRKYLSFGFLPHQGSLWNRPPANVLCQQGLPYQGDGIYSTMPLKKPPKAKPHGSFYAWNAGVDSGSRFLLGLLNTPISLLFGGFMPYEHGRHYYGRFLSRERKYSDSGIGYTSSTYRSEDIELLMKFSVEEREKIGAWTYREDAAHPHNTFANSFDRASLFGFYKWCYYVVHDPQPTEKTVHADAKSSTISKTITGPFSVQLSLPDLEYYQTVEVESGATAANFRLTDAANGASFANGTVRFLPPPGGLSAVRNEDDRAMLELAMEREWPVKVELPAPRIVSTGETSAKDRRGTRSEESSYRIVAIGRTEDGKGLVVRVTVNDTGKTFEIDRQVQPEVRRMFREQFATGTDATRRENVRMELVDGDKTLVYTVVFE